MGVFIKGMEMPTSCDDCFLPLRYCPYAMKPNGECPLVPVPPHGRCIDADALIVELMDRGVEGLQTDDWYEIQQVVADAPTIIPAEEGE